MDGGSRNHYVATRAALAGERPLWIRLLELLLFLSAMLAGLTGLISGDRAVETRQFERTVAASAAVEVGARTAEAATMATVAYPSAPGAISAADPEPVTSAEAARETPPVDERRLE